MQTLTFKAQATNAFFGTVNQMFGGSSQLPTTAECTVINIIEHSSDNETVLGSNRQLGGVAEHLIDGTEKRICRLSFEFQSLHEIERRRNFCYLFDNKTASLMSKLRTLRIPEFISTSLLKRIINF